MALVAVLMGTTVVILRSEWGGERLRHQVVARVNKQIQGRLDIDRLAFGGDKVQVWGVALRDPEGGLVTHVARAEVDFALLRVLRKELRVTAVAIDTPIVSLVSDVDGSNLARATASRQKKPPKPPEPKKVDPNGPEGWVIRIDRFELTHGDVSTAVATEDGSAPRAHLSGLGLSGSARHAMGNGATDLTLRVSGQSERVPVGPLRLAAQLAAHGDVTRFDADGELLGGTLKAHGSVDAQHLDQADVVVALAIPAQDLGGYEWGPVRIDARAQPATTPNLDVLVKVPGLALAAKDRGAEGPFGVRGRLTVADLALFGRAAHVVGGTLPALAGRGELTFGFEKGQGTGLSGFEGETQGAFETLRFGETLLSRLTVEGQTAHLSARPGDASFALSIASLSTATKDVRGIELSLKLQQQDLSATFGVAAPARVDLTMAGRLSEDRHVFDLSSLVLTFPEEVWNSQGIARLRSDDKELSLSSFRLTSADQMLAIDASRRGEDLAAHLALTGLRLGRLPTVLVDPALQLDGVLNADVKAEGRSAAPKVVARVDLQQARYQHFSKIDAKLNATLQDEQLKADMDVQSPFMTATGAFQLPTDLLLDPGAALDVKLDVKHLDVGELLRAADHPAPADGRLNLKLRVEGSADDPKATLTMQLFDLELKPGAGKATADAGKATADAVQGSKSPAEATAAAGKAAKKALKDAPPPQASLAKPAKSVDLGHARVRVTYEDRALRVEVDFGAAHGGTVVIDASTRIDLSYPQVKRPIVAKKLPIHGKVVARDLDVAWVAELNPRVESMGGQVTADGRLDGTVADPRVVGDVHWKNGELVATKPPLAARKPASAARPDPPSGR